jgi:hypothetical protein
LGSAAKHKTVTLAVGGVNGPDPRCRSKMRMSYLGKVEMSY